MNWTAFAIGCLSVVSVVIIGTPLVLILRDFIGICKERRQNRKWLKHCKSCLYFRRIQFTSLDNYHKRGVVCDNGIDFEYTEDPMKCERYKRKSLQ